LIAPYFEDPRRRWVKFIGTALAKPIHISNEALQSVLIECSTVEINVGF
jgi:hypothetical protein